MTATPSWLDSVHAHDDGSLEIRFTGGRRVDTVELLNPTSDRLTAAELCVQPGDALVFHTSAPEDVVVRTSLPHDPFQDDAGVYSIVYRHVSSWGPMVELFRTAGSISNEAVKQRCGEGLYRISVHHALSIAADSKVLSIREVEVHAAHVRRRWTCPHMTGGDANGEGAVPCGRPGMYHCSNHATLLCERHRSSCCTLVAAETEAAP